MALNVVFLIVFLTIGRITMLHAGNIVNSTVNQMIIMCARFVANIALIIYVLIHVALMVVLQNNGKPICTNLLVLKKTNTIVKRIHNPLILIWL